MERGGGAETLNQTKKASNIESLTHTHFECDTWKWLARSDFPNLTTLKNARKNSSKLALFPNLVLHL